MPPKRKLEPQQGQPTLANFLKRQRSEVDLNKIPASSSTSANTASSSSNAASSSSSSSLPRPSSSPSLSSLSAASAPSPSTSSLANATSSTSSPSLATAALSFAPTSVNATSSSSSSTPATAPSPPSGELAFAAPVPSSSSSSSTNVPPTPVAPSSFFTVKRGGGTRVSDKSYVKVDNQPEAKFISKSSLQNPFHATRRLISSRAELSATQVANVEERIHALQEALAGPTLTAEEKHLLFRLFFNCGNVSGQGVGPGPPAIREILDHMVAPRVPFKHLAGPVNVFAVKHAPDLYPALSPADLASLAAALAANRIFPPGAVGGAARVNPVSRALVRAVIERVSVVFETPVGYIVRRLLDADREKTLTSGQWKYQPYQLLICWSVSVSGGILDVGKVASSTNRGGGGSGYPPGDFMRTLWTLVVGCLKADDEANAGASSSSASASASASGPASASSSGSTLAEADVEGDGSNGERRRSILAAAKVTNQAFGFAELAYVALGESLDTDPEWVVRVSKADMRAWGDRFVREAVANRGVDFGTAQRSKILEMATRVVDAEQTRILPAAGLVRTAWTIEEDRVLAGRYRDAGLDDNFGREDEAELLNLRRLLPNIQGIRWRINSICRYSRAEFERQVADMQALPQAEFEALYEAARARIASWTSTSGPVSR